MVLYGICAKCGEYKEVRSHHYKGYDSDETIPYCRSCDRKAHDKARKNGRCKLTHDEANRLSIKSCRKRCIRKIGFNETMMPNVRYCEDFHYNINTDALSIACYFSANNGRSIFYLNEGD